MIAFIRTLIQLLHLVDALRLSRNEAHIATIQVNNVRTIRAMTGYIECSFDIGQQVARQARFAGKNFRP